METKVQNCVCKKSFDCITKSNEHFAQCALLIFRLHMALGSTSQHLPIPPELSMLICLTSQLSGWHHCSCQCCLLTAQRLNLIILLPLFDLPVLAERRFIVCSTLFKQITSESHVLHYLLPAKHDTQLASRLRSTVKYPTVHARQTDLTIFSYRMHSRTSSAACSLDCVNVL